MIVATMPEVLVLMATIAARIAMMTAIPTAVNMKETRRPSFSMVYQVPNDEIKNQICRKPDMSSAMWYEKPTDSWKL